MVKSISVSSEAGSRLLSWAKQVVHNGKVDKEAVCLGGHG